MDELDNCVAKMQINNQPKVAHSDDPIQQAYHNRATVNWSNCMKPYEIDEQAFRIPVAPKDTAASILAENRRKNYFKRKLVEHLTTVGSFEQQRLVLMSTLTDPKVVNVASSLGVNLEEARVHRDICHSIRKYMRMARTRDKKGQNFKVSANGYQCYLPSGSDDPSKIVYPTTPSQKAE